MERRRISGAILDAPLSPDELEDMNKGNSQDGKGLSSGLCWSEHSLLLLDMI